jgi:hypothetical protein
MSMAAALALRLFFRLLDMLKVVFCFGLDGATALALAGTGPGQLDPSAQTAQDAPAADRDVC